jgi:hypothetical protein
MDCSITSQALLRLSVCFAFSHALSTILSTKAPLSEEPQNATATSPPIRPKTPLGRVGVSGSKRSFGTLLLDMFPIVSSVSAQITMPSKHLNPAIIVTAGLFGGRSLGFGFPYGSLDITYAPWGVLSSSE